MINYSKPLKLKLTDLNKKPKYAELIYNHYQKRYRLHIVVEIKNKQVEYENNEVLAIDLGQIHPLTTYDGQQVVIFNGGKLNSFIRYRNKELSKLQNMMSRCRKNSSRWRKLNYAKQKVLEKSRNKIMDVLKKYTSYLIDYCIRHKISTIVAGDIINIRDNIKYGRKTNQKLHQWVFKIIMKMIEYKAESVGINFELIDESYTSQRCPICGSKNKVNDRNYSCSKCNFKYHRDGVGAINIFKKYTVGSLTDKSDWLEGTLH